MEEIWVDIKEFEGKYQISNTGKVKSINYCNTKKEKLLSPNINKRGIYAVNLCKNNKTYNCTVALLVAKHFLKKNNEKDVVIHIGEKTDDNVNNLKYVSQSEARYYERHKKSKTDLIDEIYMNGEINKYKEHAEKNGITVHQMYRRLYDGWSIDEAINIPIKREQRLLKIKLYKYNDKLYSLKELSKMSGMTEKTIWKRLNRGWNINEAVEIPLSKFNKKGKNGD